MSAKRRATGPAVTRKPRKPGTTRRRLRRALKWFLIVAIVGTLMLAGGFVYLYQTTPIPNPNKDFQTQTSFVYYSDGKTQLGQYATQNRQIISYADMPQQLKDAVVAAEDRTFYTDSGIDPKGIVRAAFNDARGGATQGASTITQQYVKILYLTQERSLNRKVHEAILSLKLQKQQSKQEILTGYLNTIYFGRGAYGVQAAAKAYFGVDADKLSLRQSAVLASVLNNPSQFDPANGKSNKAALLARYRYVLAGMASMNKVPDAQAARAEKRLPRFPVFKASSQYGGQKGHMLTLVRQELHRPRLHRRPDRRRWPAGHHDLHPEGDGGGRGGRQAGAARPQRQEAPRRGGHGPARYRCAARLLRRSELPPLPDQLGRGRWHGRLDVQAGLARGGHHRRLLPEEHVGRQLALHLPRRAGGAQRGARARHELRRCGLLGAGARAVDQHRVRGHVGQHGQGTRQDPLHGQQDGDPAGHAGPPLPGHPEPRRATSSPTP